MAQVRTRQAPLDARELTNEQEWSQAWPVLRQLRPHLKLEFLLQSRESLIALGYKLYGLYVNDRIVAVCAFFVHPHVEHGRAAWLADLVTDSTERGNGYGAALLQSLERVILEAGCTRICLHTEISNVRAQHFYNDHAKYDRYAVVYRRLLSDRGADTPGE